MQSVRRLLSIAGSGLLVSLATGCLPRSGYSTTALVAGVPVPEGWSPTAMGPEVPGVRLGSWTGPEGASLVLYRTLAIPDPDPVALGLELANRLTNLPEARVLRTETHNGPAGAFALVEVVAPGDGSRLAPSGLGQPRLDSGTPPIPTRQLTAGYPGPTQTVWLVAHYPDAVHARLGPVVEQIVRGWNPDPSRSAATAAP
ncbi:MAG: hypothetical protein KatS3mg108_3151 [Isosphaeraceae bacterium]|jgi:hypothetical protein|nr:MAG: hypothetical protein KatS3mg108_3151 [Isosphaeraceae bacterium]